MFKPASLFIGLRYTRAKRRNHFISFISLSSMIGIALGVAVLITVLSVMNGFDAEIKNRILELAPQVTVNNFTGKIDNWQDLQTQFSQYKNVVAVAPFVSGQGMLSNQGTVRPVLIEGVDPSQEITVSKIATKMSSGSFDKLKSGEFGIILGQELADALGVSLGNKITVVTPEAVMSPAGVIPIYKRFTVVGIFDAGSGFGFDSQLAYIDMADSQALFNMGTTVSGLHLKLTDLYDAAAVTQNISKNISTDYYITNWTMEYGPLFKALQLEKTMMFLILMLIVAVAAFNLVSSLVMVVNDKRADIAILRTFGATPQMIMNIFIVQGFIIGAFGTLLGLIGGIVLSLNATAIVDWIQKVFNVQFLSSSVYYVDYLPSKLVASDVIHVCFAAFILTLIATLYPAWRGSKTQPAEALRYE